MARKKITEDSSQSSGDVLQKEEAKVSGIEALEKIGLKEVSTKTYIDLNYLKMMVAKEFSKLQRIKTIGFVRIIQREYNIDMSDWVAEFEEYLKSIVAPPKESEQTDEVLARHKETYRRKKIYVTISILILALLLVFAYMFFRGRTSQIEATFMSANATYSETLNDINMTIGESENTFVEENIAEAVNANATEMNMAERANTTEVDVENASEESVFTISQPNVTTQQPAIAVQAATPLYAANDSVHITPNAELWVGIIDLETLGRNTYIVRRGLNITTSKEQLVITGHGDFTLRFADGSFQSFNPKQRAFLHIKDGIATSVTESEFIAMNRGVIW